MQETNQISDADCQEMHIAVPFSYPVIFSRCLFSLDNTSLADFLSRQTGRSPHRCMVVVDGGLAAAQPRLMADIQNYFMHHRQLAVLAADPLVITGGEDCKNSFEATLKIVRLARQLHLCRQSFIIGIGGGAVLDVVGFAASLIHRGVRLIRVPTTVLAQNDSGVGVKNGVNLRGVKNFLGTFAPPAAVFNDASFLQTLTDRDWIAGIAEAFKVAIIKDRNFLDWLVACSEALRRRDAAAMEQLIRRCAQLHLRHIAENGDPFEFGSARPLDFGHWAAHKLESLTVHELRHGEAVAIGMSIDLLYAAAQKYISSQEAREIIGALAAAGLPVWHETIEMCDQLGRPLIFNGLEEFREHLGGELHITLPRPLGRSFEVQSMDEATLAACLRQLHNLAVVICD